MQHCRMRTVLPVSKRGTITLPAEIRKKLGLDQMPNALLLIEESNGKLVIEAAAAVPVRDIPLEEMRSWIAEDENAMKALKKTVK